MFFFFFDTTYPPLSPPHHSLLLFFLSSLSQVIIGLALQWVVGIAFMLIVTVLVLELREVLHPDVFDGIIRVPDDQHLLLTLIEDTLLHHLRRITVSTLVYGTLIGIICYLPTYVLQQQIFRTTMYDGIFPIPFPTYYLWTTGQVAAEVRISLFFFFFFSLVLSCSHEIFFCFFLLFLPSPHLFPHSSSGCRGARHRSPIGGSSQDALVQFFG